MTARHFSLLGHRLDPSNVVEKTDCRELLEAHRNVIDCISHDLIGSRSFFSYLTHVMA